MQIEEWSLVVEYNMDKITGIAPKYNQNYKNDFRRRNVRGNFRSNQI